MFYHLKRFLFGMDSRERAALLITQAIKEHGRIMATFLEEISEEISKYVDDKGIEGPELTAKITEVVDSKVTGINNQIVELQDALRLVAKTVVEGGHPAAAEAVSIANTALASTGADTISSATGDAAEAPAADTVEG